MPRSVRQVVRTIATLPILLYQKLISPAIPSHCIYAPTCSEYGRESLLRHGLVKGFGLMAARVIRCSSLFTGGYDPVPTEASFHRIGADYRRFWRRGADSREHESPNANDSVDQTS